MEESVILVVDDNPTNLDVLLEIFDQTNFDVSFVKDGESCLEIANADLPDLILLDIMMPGIDGFEVCRRLKANEHTQDIPVIFMTALADTVNKVRGFELGAVDYITKPIHPQEVLARVNTHLTIRSQQRQLQQKNTLIQEQNEQLQQLNASKDKFFSIISHDLRNPLQGVLGISQLLAEKIDRFSKEQVKDFATKLENSVEKLNDLLENLLTWSRIQREMIEFHPQPIEVKGVIARNIALFMTSAEQKQITLASSVPERAVIYGDYEMVDTVLRNLLSNALKFTDSGGTISITARQDETSVELSVADTGVGIEAKYMSRLFRIDQQYRRLGTAHERGTGLGLILCKEFVERHGGRIWVESEVEKGSVFRFTLPQTSWNGNGKRKRRSLMEEPVI